MKKYFSIFLSVLLFLAIFSGCNIQRPDDVAADVLAKVYASEADEANSTEDDESTLDLEHEDDGEEDSENTNTINHSKQLQGISPNTGSMPSSSQGAPSKVFENSQSYYDVDSYTDTQDYSKYASSNRFNDTESENGSGNLGRIASDGTRKTQDQYLTDPIPAGKPQPVEWQGKNIDTSVVYYATLSVRCDTILNNMADLTPGKEELVPADGVIYPEQTVAFYKGESVFDVLLREMQRNRIHMEYSMSPIYNSAYIEGINNLYEFDCGNLSGWMYKVDGWFPNYGCSRYELVDGEKIEWVYTCKNLGLDVGCTWMWEMEGDQ